MTYTSDSGAGLISGKNKAKVSVKYGLSWECDLVSYFSKDAGVENRVRFSPAYMLGR